MKNLIQKAQNKVDRLHARACAVIASKRAEMYVDKGVSIIIAVVVGALLLAGVYAIIKTNVLDIAATKISEMFDYTA